MIFFIFSFFASIIGGISSGSFFNLSLHLNLSVDSPFSSIIAFWPFIVALVLLLLTIMWYQHVKSVQRRRKQPSNRRRPGTQSMVFMGIVTVFALVLLAAPYYLESYADPEEEETEQISEENRVEVNLTVHGMDCGGCEALVNRRVGNLEGVENVMASHMREEVMVVYDRSKVSMSLITQTIEDSGYTVTSE